MILTDLNPSQQQAVECCDAPSLVIAGAGSGKTRVLTYKIAYLLQHKGYSPWSILALTFTNKAAREMKERISRTVGDERASALWMGTFHSIFSRILRIESSLLGFTSDFTIYDSSDSKNLVKSIIHDLKLDEKQYKPSTVASYISQAKNNLVLPSSYANSGARKRDAAANMPMVYEIYAHYFRRCRQSNVMDFDDLLLYTWLLLKQHPEVAQKYQDRFQYVLVDEYQDTNFAQHEIVWLLTNRNQRLCVVGDDAQSIYSFRGANIDNILQFQKRYPGTRLFKLEQNYRSTQTIVGAANSVIQHNRHQIHKEVFSQNGSGTPISVYSAFSDIDEAHILVRILRGYSRTERIPFKEMAVLYRTNAQSRSLEEGLRKAGLPYRIYGGLSFYQRKEIKDVIAYFRMCVNPNDEESLKRIINYPTRGIGQTTLQKILLYAHEHNTTAWQALQQPELLGVNRGTATKLDAFCQLIESFRSEASTIDAYTLGRRIISESGIQKDIFTGTDPDAISRQENLQELLDGISSFVEQAEEEERGTLLTHYLQEVSLLSDQDEDDTEGDDKITLMTIHAAKGLEFDAVVVVGLEENLFPSQMCIDSPQQVEEERRLFYVAMTRARHHLALTHAKSRFRYGKTEFSSPSRFLKEIDSRFLSQQGSGDTPSESRFGSASQPRLSGFRNIRSIAKPAAPTPASPSHTGKFVPASVSASNPGTAPTVSPQQLQPGTRIIHNRFGMGTVLYVEGEGMDTKTKVRFDNVGEKLLLLRFAKITLAD